jgi:hypothetical protein
LTQHALEKFVSPRRQPRFDSISNVFVWHKLETKNLGYGFASDVIRRRAQASGYKNNVGTIE